jgi:hypothetical protein
MNPGIKVGGRGNKKQVTWFRYLSTVIKKSNARLFMHPRLSKIKYPAIIQPHGSQILGEKTQICIHPNPLGLWPVLS